MPSRTSTNASTAETTFTLRDQPYTYMHMQLTTLSTTIASNRSQTQTSLDEITLRQYLTSALTQSFGITGSAVAVDILKTDKSEAWIRLQTEDAELLVAGLSQWTGGKGTVGLRVLGRATWLGGLAMRPGEKNCWNLDH